MGVTTPDADGASDWTVSVHVDAPRGIDVCASSVLQGRQLGDLITAYGGGHPVVTTSSDDLEVIFSIEDNGLWDAYNHGMGIWKLVAQELELTRWAVTDVRICTYKALERSRAHIPDLVGISEVAKMLGVTKQRASALYHEDRLPRPAAMLRSGPVWVAAGVEKFKENWVRRVGRPRGNDAV